MQQNFVKIPKDLSLIKQKFIFGLTKRQAMCFGIGLAMGIPAFFIIKTVTSNITVAVIALGIFAFPASPAVCSPKTVCTWRSISSCLSRL